MSNEHIELNPRRKVFQEVMNLYKIVKEDGMPMAAVQPPIHIAEGALVKTDHRWLEYVGDPAFVGEPHYNFIIDVAPPWLPGEGPILIGPKSPFRLLYRKSHYLNGAS